MSVKDSLMVRLISNVYSISNRFLNSSWNLICYPICEASALGGILVINFLPFHRCVQFDVARNYYVVTSNVDLADDCNVSDDVWPVC